MMKYTLERQITREFLNNSNSLLKESSDDLRGIETREVQKTKRSILDVVSDLLPGLDKAKGIYSILSNLNSALEGSEIKDMVTEENYKDLSYLLKLVDNINNSLSRESIESLIRNKPKGVPLGAHILSKCLEDIEFEGASYQLKKQFDLQVGDSDYDWEGVK